MRIAGGLEKLLEIWVAEKSASEAAWIDGLAGVGVERSSLLARVGGTRGAPFVSLTLGLAHRPWSFR